MTGPLPRYPRTPSVTPIHRVSESESDICAQAAAPPLVAALGTILHSGQWMGGRVRFEKILHRPLPLPGQVRKTLPPRDATCKTWYTVSRKMKGWKTTTHFDFISLFQPLTTVRNIQADGSFLLPFPPSNAKEHH